MTETARQVQLPLPLPELSEQPAARCEVFVFPIGRRLGEVRRIAEAMIVAERARPGHGRGEAFNAGLRSECEALRAVGFPAELVFSEIILKFGDLVESEHRRLAGQDRTHGDGAA